MAGFGGAFAALTTPFSANGEVDLQRLVSRAQALVASGLDGVVPAGTNGEGAALPPKTRRAMTEALVRGDVSANQLVIGVADTAIEEAAANVRHAGDVGCRGVLLAPPFYLPNPSDEGLYEWFSRVFDRVGANLRGVVLYHIPQVTHVPLSATLVTRLRHDFGSAIVAVKDSGGVLETTRQFLSIEGVSTLVGHEKQLPGMMREGATGAISGLANLLPEALAATVHQGQSDERVEQVFDLVSRYPSVPAVKALVAHAQRDQVWARVRPPLVALDADARAALTADFDQICGMVAA